MDTKALIDKFTAVLHALDPMGLNSPREDEYASEALSILARFNESGFHFGSRDSMLPFAIEIIEEVMKYWFSSIVDVDASREKWTAVAVELLDAYIGKDQSQ